jgi:hypothetical protein
MEGRVVMALERAVALTMGLAAWLGVAVISVLVVNAWSDDNQVGAFFPIAAAVVGAWLIGEWVTGRVFPSADEEEAGHGN